MEREKHAWTRVSKIPGILIAITSGVVVAAGIFGAVAAFSHTTNVLPVPSSTVRIGRAIRTAKLVPNVAVLQLRRVSILMFNYCKFISWLDKIQIIWLGTGQQLQ